LKLAQYEESRRKGYEFIEWTFDPLESRNAYFNLRKLGCTAEEYEVNIYGITSSPLHGGMPTDRLIAHWAIPRIEKTTPDLNSVPEPPALVTKTKTDAQGVLRLDEIRLNSSETFLYMEIPEEIQQIKAQSPDAALDWRMKTRRIFQHYLDRGYHVDSFLRLQSRSFYVFRKTTEAQRH
jgi:predicted GNAT superfamily acetyltransferase